jgi:enoyl-CoA hydratase/carnithine racemase
VPQLDHDGDVFVLQLGDGENRFNRDFLDEVGALVEEVAAASAPRALVTAATGKIWSNGLDLEWMSRNAQDIPALLDSLHALYARLLALGVPTVAAIQGHAFAGGAMLALAHDIRVMRSDRGWFCLPEVDINIPFTPGMSALITARLSKATAHEAMTTGRRYGGEEAVAASIAAEAVPEAEVLPRAVAIAAGQAGKDPGTLGTIKQRMYAAALDALTDTASNSIALPAS